MTDIFALLQPKWNPKVIIGWIAGSLVEEVERLSDEEFEKGIMLVLDLFYGNKYNVTIPKRILRYSTYLRFS